MISLSEFLNVNVLEATRKKYPGYLEYIVRTSKLASNEKLIFYLEQYSLYSSKHLNFKDWQKVVEIIKKKEHKTITGKDKIKLMKDKMNNNRTEFN